MQAAPQIISVEKDVNDLNPKITDKLEFEPGDGDKKEEIGDKRSKREHLEAVEREEIRIEREEYRSG